jgi:hypothetical protein
VDRSIIPNTTQFPNVLTDQVMALVTSNEWKVVHYGVRYALGHRSTDTLTITQIAHGRQDESGVWVDHGTGLEEAEVKTCLIFLCDETHIFLREDRPRKPLGYRLNTDLSSINWEVLEARLPLPQADAEPVVVVEAPPPPPPPAATPVVARPRPARSDAPYIEQPATDFHIDGSVQPVLQQMHGKLTVDEGRSFDYLLDLAKAKVRDGLDEDIVWPLYRLWRTYGFRRLQNAFQSPEPVESLDDVNQSCLVGILADTLDKERFGPITPTFREQIIEMAQAWPDLNEWQTAITIAVRINKRRLQTVETILKNNAAPPSAQSQGDRSQGDRSQADRSQGDRHDAGPTAPEKGRKRPARRVSEYSDEEISAAREAERGKDWQRPE